MPDETGGPYPGDGSNGPNVLDDSMEGVAVYLWHCNRDGQYSLYPQGVSEKNYLRGVQATNAAGTATYTSIFPAAYEGRWPHIHFEVYSSHRQPDHRRLTGRRQFGENRADG